MGFLIFLPEDQKLKIILSDGNNLNLCERFLEIILKIRRSELMKPQGG